MPGIRATAPHELSDKRLAERYVQARYAIAARPNDAERIDTLLELENELCGRLELDLDETEQGLTPSAVAAIDAWVAAQVTS